LGTIYLNMLLFYKTIKLFLNSFGGGGD
jgi:hypothetical protein